MEQTINYREKILEELNFVAEEDLEGVYKHVQALGKVNKQEAQAETEPIKTAPNKIKTSIDNALAQLLYLSQLFSEVEKEDLTKK